MNRTKAAPKRKAVSKSKNAGSPRRKVSKYATAKVVILGEQGVGKTALGWRLVGRDFNSHPKSHPLQSWILKDLSSRLPDGTLCDAVLWDMASQPDYRLIHPLSTADASLALIVFDPTLRPDTFRPISYWLNHLSDSQRKRCPSILVAARTEVGAPVFTKKELESFCKKNRVSGGYVQTSAARGDGIIQLKNRIRSLLKKGGVRPTVVAKHFHAIKDLILEVKRKGRASSLVLSPQQLLSRLKKAGVYDIGRDELMEVLRQLANYSYVRVIGVSEAESQVLLAPELFDGLAASFVSAARQHPQGLGVLEEERVLSNRFDFQEVRGLSESNQKSMLQSVVLAFLEKNLTLRCLREKVGQKSLLFFPDIVTMKRPNLNDNIEYKEGASYTVCGDTDQLFAVLVVSLAYTNTFSKNEHWPNLARYEMHEDSICGFRIEDERERELDLTLFASEKAALTTRNLFQDLVENFLLRRRLSFSRFDPVVCNQCGLSVERKVVRDRLKQGKDFVFCPECRENLPLQKPVESSELTHVESRKVKEEEWVVEQRSCFEVAIFGVQEHKKKKGLWTPKCFISYAWGDKKQERWVEILATDLQKAGVNVLLDKWQNAHIGSSISRFTEKIEECDKIIVVGTPAYRKKYANNEEKRGFVVATEGDLMAPRMLGTEKEKKSVMPILLEGEVKESLPLWLQSRVHADFRKERAYFTKTFDLILSLYDIDPNDPGVAGFREPLDELE